MERGIPPGASRLLIYGRGALAAAERCRTWQSEVPELFKLLQRRPFVLGLQRRPVTMHDDLWFAVQYIEGDKSPTENEWLFSSYAQVGERKRRLHEVVLVDLSFIGI